MGVENAIQVKLQAWKMQGGGMEEHTAWGEKCRSREQMWKKTGGLKMRD